MSENRIFFIINKKAGVGYHAALEGRIIDACTQRDWECELQYTAYPGHAAALAQAALRNGHRRIVAVGGDGTINEVARSLVGTQALLGILPKGSGNGLARHLGISLNLEEALRQLFRPGVTAMDTITINGRLSVNVSGIGFDGHVASLFGKNGNRGLASYVSIVLREYARFQPFSFSMTPNHPAQHAPVYMLCFANSSQFGNHARIAPEASVRDGWIEVVAISDLSLFNMFRLARQSWLRKHNQSAAPQMRVRHARIELDRPVAYHVDGEPCPPEQQFEIQVAPQSLQILGLPADFGM